MKWAVAALALAALQDADWWNADWGARRKVTVQNRLKAPLKGGVPVHLKLNAGFTGLDKKCQPGYGDLRLVHKGKEIPIHFEASSKEEITLTFRLPADLAPRTSDVYYLYYGNPSAKPAQAAKSDIYELVADFSSEDDLKPFAVDPGLQCKVANGRLQIQSQAAEAASIRLRNIQPVETFLFRMNFALEGGRADQPGETQILVHLRPRPGEKADPEVEKKVDELLGKLADDAYRVREEATKAIIELGKPAVRKVEQAFQDTKDPEVKWRCEYILQEVAKRSPVPEILAQYNFLPAGRGDWVFTMTAALPGKTVTLQQHFRQREIRLEIARIEKSGAVIVRDPLGGIALGGEIAGEIEEAWIEFKNARGATVQIDHLSIQRYLSDLGRPSFEVDIEESKK